VCSAGGTLLKELNTRTGIVGIFTGPDGSPCIAMMMMMMMMRREEEEDHRRHHSR
jgi:hypothetical protein